MANIVLIDPNTSDRTTQAMLASARAALPPPKSTIRGATAARGAAMILDGEALAAAADEVARIGPRAVAGCDAVVVSAFGDPGVARRRAVLDIPVVGIGEAGLREASAGSRRFGVAATAPGLAARMEAGFTVLRVCAANPTAHAADPAGQDAALARAVEDCMAQDGAEPVVIGGAP